MYKKMFIPNILKNIGDLVCYGSLAINSSESLVTVDHLRRDF